MEITMMDEKTWEVAKIMCALKKEWYEEEAVTKKQFHLWLAEKIAKEAKGKRWIPQSAEKYFYIDSIGEVHAAAINVPSDHLRISLGNCYKTFAEAEKHAALVKAAYIADVE